MEGKLSRAAKKLTSSPIQELSHLAHKCNAINLAKGFLDFLAPSHIKNVAVFAIHSDFNQYRHVQGICDHLTKTVKEMHGLDFNPLTDITICYGQSEALAAAVFASVLFCPEAGRPLLHEYHSRLQAKLVSHQYFVEIC